MRSAISISLVGHKRGVVLVVSLSAFVFTFATTSLTVALPNMVVDLGSDIATLQWLMTGYFLANTVALPPLGRVADYFSHKSIFIVGVFVFTMACALAAIAGSAEQLIALRVLQGLGGAVIMGNAVALLAASYSPRERGRAVGYYNLALSLGNISGGAIGGLLVDSFGWRGVFIFVVPLGFLTTALAIVLLREHHQKARGARFDWGGTLLLATSLTSFLLAMTFGQKGNWASATVGIPLVLSVVAFSTFCLVEKCLRQPLIDLATFSNFRFTAASVVSALNFLASIPVQMLMPFYLQNVLGYSPTEVGVLLMPLLGLFVVASPIGGRLSDRWGSRMLSAGGLATAALSMFILSTLGPDSSYGVALVGMVLLGGGLGISSSPATRMGVNAVSREDLAIAAAILGMMRNLGKTLGSAVAGTVVVSRLPYYLDQLSAQAASSTSAAQPAALSAAIRDTYFFVGLLILAGALLMLACREENASS
ncbi:MAG: MFS transporter [Chloroflexi bacterium]|nr:MFS transporter [Chloroflexota bacterium]